jgi:hypothetical protein
MAQQGPWSFAVSPYLWAPGASSSVDTQFGTLDTDATIGEVVSSTDFALMGVLEARNGRWGFIADLLHSDLTERRDTPFGVLFSRARVDTSLTKLSGDAAYRMYDDGQVALDAMGGFRAVSLGLDVSLSPGALPARSFSDSSSWLDPLVGGRARIALTARWFATALGDIGGFGVGSDLTWQVLATIGYRFDERWSVQGGWRHLSIDKEVNGRDVELDLGGPVLGFTVRF